MKIEDIPFLWAYAKGLWPNFEIPTDDLGTRARVQVWLDLLGEFDGETVKVALLRCSTASTFAPTAGDIRVACAAVRAEASGEMDIPDLELAWAEVMAQVRFVGMYGEPEWSHPVLQRAMLGFGWVDFCTSTDPVGVLRGQFRQFYESARAGYEKALVGITAPELAYRERAIGHAPVGILQSTQFEG